MFKGIQNILFSARNLGLKKTSPLISQRPQFYLLSNVDRLKVKPKILESPIPFIEKDIFQSEATLLLYQLEKAFENLKEFEPRISSIELSSSNDAEDSKLAVNIQHVGMYQIYTDTNLRVMYLHSPESGLFKYYFDVNYKMWVSNKDQHFLVENLTRETSKNCQAYLNI